MARGAAGAAACGVGHRQRPPTAHHAQSKAAHAGAGSGRSACRASGRYSADHLVDFSRFFKRLQSLCFGVYFGWALVARQRRAHAALLGVGDQRPIDLDPVAVGKHGLAIGELAEDADPGASDVGVWVTLRQSPNRSSASPTVAPAGSRTAISVARSGNAKNDGNLDAGLGSQS